MAVVFTLCAPAGADYNSDLRDAAKAYKDGRLQESLNLYTAVYEQNPTYQVKAYIVSLKNKLRNEGEEPRYDNADGDEEKDAAKAYKEGRLQDSLNLYAKAYKEHPTYQVKAYIVFLKNRLMNEMEDPGNNEADMCDSCAEKKFLITFNAPALLGFMVYLHAETAVGGCMGAALNGGPMFGIDPVPGESSYMAGLEYNFYPQGRSLNGWYLAPVFNVFILSQDHFMGNDAHGNPVYSNKLETSFFPLFGAHFGYRWIWDSGLTLDLNIGIGLVFGEGFMDLEGSPTANSAVLLPLLGCDLGYAW